VLVKLSFLINEWWEVFCHPFPLQKKKKVEQVVRIQRPSCFGKTNNRTYISQAQKRNDEQMIELVAEGTVSRGTVSELEEGHLPHAPKAAASQLPL
jgi:hypothetical protein